MPDDLAAVISKLNRRIDSVQQSKPTYPVCRIILPADEPIGSGEKPAGTPASGGVDGGGANWTPDPRTGDPDGLVTLTHGAPYYATIPFTGRYFLKCRMSYTSSASGNAAIAVLYLNGVTSANILEDQDVTTRSTFDNRASVTVEDVFQAGDQIYWGSRGNVALTARGSSNGYAAVSYFYLRYIGSK